MMQTFFQISHRILIETKECDCLFIQDKAWAFERVVGMDLKGHEGRMVSNVPSRRDCEEACLRETGFRCRSAVYNTVSLDCALSQETRRTRPEAYTPGRNTEYLENQCVSSGRTQSEICTISGLFLPKKIQLVKPYVAGLVEVQ